jgi:hypothetical protein
MSNVKLKNERTKMKMTINQKSVLAAGAMALMLALPQAQANPSLNGSIGFAGTFAVPSGSTLGNTKELDGITATVVGIPSPPTGSFLGTAGTTANFADPLFLTSSASYVAPFTLWSFTTGGNAYLFEATSETILLQSSVNGGILDLVGNGWATINGLDQTPGTWSLTASASGTAPKVTFGFESTATVVGSVPDSGMTLGLLGSAMLALQGLRRKLGC